MNRTVISIKGMHCKSCEVVIGEKLNKLQGVNKVLVNRSKGTAEIYHKGTLINQRAVFEAVKSVGYTVDQEGFSNSWFSKNKADYTEFAKAVAIVGLLIFIGIQTGIFTKIHNLSFSSNSLPLVLLIGVTAGFSTCMALVGGLVLSISASFMKTGSNLSGFDNLKPHLLFNLSRVGFFFLLGGIAGSIGGIFQFSSFITGILTLVAATLMVFFGLQFSGLFPKLQSLNFTLPLGLSRKLGIGSYESHRNKNALLLGGLSFFLPCGFTQSMQLLSVSSGSFLSGGLIMSVFALGTVPGLLSIGGLTTLFKGRSAASLYKLASVIILVLAVINLNRGITLTGLRTGNITFHSSETSRIIENQDQLQKISAVFNGGFDFKPNSFTVKAGIPVLFTVDAKVDGTGCMSALMIPGLIDRATYLQAGTNHEFKFTPTRKGEYEITCAMGVPWGKITVE